MSKKLGKEALLSKFEEIEAYAKIGYTTTCFFEKLGMGKEPREEELTKSGFDMTQASKQIKALIKGEE